MPHRMRATRSRLRTVFVSDVHLGCKFSQADRFLQFLEAHQPEHLYIVGDFIDGWKLRKRWYWQSAYLRIFHRLMALRESGTQLYYAPGNHDDFLRHFLHDFGFVQIADEFIHTAADQRRFLVLHGDQFDEVERRFGWLSHVGSSLYDVILWANATINRVRRGLRLSELQFSARLKLSVKQAVRFVSQFEERLAEHARQYFCDGIICGHI
ncbi:MAG: UDP-2,3-diacylglucosamine diphosphatase, partial [Pirellulaceae bacterium]